MQLNLPISLQAMLLCLSLATAASVPAPAKVSKRQARIPHKIDLGTYNNLWDRQGRAYQATRILAISASLCPDTDYQYSMQGCGGDGLWIMRNGVENVGDCYWAPGNNACVAGESFKGQWQCVLNDGNM
ncbi:hypothetical protein VE02_00575 [Pseudogymnoascus sp. 03VT05]|nr:hypothetical protein VE02_00575 [Pseudogymnoascus sp. 03VT05]